MRKIYFVMLAIVLTTFVNAQLVGPKIYSIEKDFDFGNIVEGSIVIHEFEVVNKGDSELYLIKVNSSCGCTVAKPSKEKLQPNESAIIKVTFNSKSRSGRQKKYINVFTNDKENTRYRLAIFANVVSKEEANKKSGGAPRITITENQHNFGIVEEGSIVTFDLGIKSSGKKTLVITDVQKSCGCTAVLLSKDKLEPGESGSIKIELNTKGMHGKKTRTIAIASNDPYNPRMVVTLFVEVAQSK